MHRPILRHFTVLKDGEISEWQCRRQTYTVESENVDNGDVHTDKRKRKLDHACSSFHVCMWGSICFTCIKIQSSPQQLEERKQNRHVPQQKVSIFNGINIENFNMFKERFRSFFTEDQIQSVSSLH